MFRVMRYSGLLLLGLIVGLAIGYLLVRQRRAACVAAPGYQLARAPAPPKPTPAAPPPSPAPAREPDPTPTQAAEPDDDLTRIAGIGPTYARALNAMGITTFAQLAEADAETLAAQIANLTAERVQREDWIGQAAALRGT